MKQMLIGLTCLSVLLGACARNDTHGANTAEQSMDTNGASIAIVPGLLEMPPSAMPAIEVLDKTIYAKPVTDLPLEAELFGPFPETFVNLSTTTQNTVVIGEDGTLWVWERVRSLQGDHEYDTVPERIGSASNWASVSLSGNALHKRRFPPNGSLFLAGGESFGIRTDGSLWRWRTRGREVFGADISHETFFIPVQIGVESTWASLSAVPGRTYAIRTDGSLWRWRHNMAGRFPDLDPDEPPIQIGRATNWVSVSAGHGNQSFAIATDGTLWGWGQPCFGTGGGWRDSPTQMGTDTDWAYVAAGMVHAVALKTDGSLWAWGRNWYGELGDGTETWHSVPTRIGTDYDWASVTVGSIGGAHVNVGHTLAVRTDGSLWAWGNNRWDGWHEMNPRSVHYIPMQVGMDTDWVSVFTSSSQPQVLAIRTDGSLWIWEPHQWGLLGDNTTGHRSPVRLIENAIQAYR